MSRPPAVSVIVPHYDDMDRLDVCLDHLSRQTLGPDRFEIVVADNGSPQGVEALEALLGDRAKLVVVNERGAGPARNGAVQASRGRILAFTDSDCSPEPDWLAQGIEGLRQHDFVGGRVRVSTADPVRMTAAEAFERVFAFDIETYVKDKHFCVTANMFCSRSTFDRVGPFRVGVPEDLDWSHRAIAAGLTLGYQKSAVIWHPARRDWTELSGKWRRLNREAFGLIGADARARRVWLLKACALPASALAHSGRVVVSPELSTVGQRLLALGMLFRLRFWRMLDAWRLFIVADRPH